jgi:acetyl esterase/lipase
MMRTGKWILGCLLVLGWAYLPGAGAVEIVHDISYLGEEREEKLDAYLPPAEFIRPVPAVVLIHGGGWGGGYRRAAREQEIGRTLAENGYAVFSISYALNQVVREEDGSTRRILVWPRNLYDCKSAVRFLRAHASDFGIDPERIATMGGSAGGHLAMLTAVTAEDEELNRGGLYLDQDNRVSCAINFYGPHEMSNRAYLFAGPTAEETAARVRAASPLTYFGPNTPPILIVQGTEDTTVRVEVARAMVAELTARAVPHQYVEIEGAGHSFALQPKQMDLRPIVLAFLAEHLGQPRRAPIADFP